MELCDGLDNDCDGSVDRGASDMGSWYQDADGDGFGDANSPQAACDQPVGTVSDNTDCVDTDDTIYPGAPELCDGLDNDCDGSPEVCDANAACIENAGGYTCECNAGYEGDGQVCTEVAVSLDGLRWDLPCVSGHGSPVCTVVSNTVTDSTTLGGDSSITYNVELRFRGLVELKTYSGGLAQGYFRTGGSDNGDGYNVYYLEVSDPYQVYYLNDGVSNIYYCFPLDYTATVPMQGGATVTLYATAKDNLEIVNIDSNGIPITIPDVDPYPAAYDGQFIQVDVLSVTY
jgi:hypothetical protein